MLTKSKTWLFKDGYTQFCFQTETKGLIQKFWHSFSRLTFASNGPETAGSSMNLWHDVEDGGQLITALRDRVLCCFPFTENIFGKWGSLLWVNFHAGKNILWLLNNWPKNQIPEFWKVCISLQINSTNLAGYVTIPPLTDMTGMMHSRAFSVNNPNMALTVIFTKMFCLYF